MDPWSAIARETEQSFDWLCTGLAEDEPVTFVPNPGNVGDAFINISCYRYLSARFKRLHVCSIEGTPATDRVFIAGGGNLIEGLYSTISDFVGQRCPGRELFFFPSSVKGFGGWLDRLSVRARIICREPMSFAHVRDHLPHERVMLGHDAAFSVADALRAVFQQAIARHPAVIGRFFRLDEERLRPMPNDGDLMASNGGNWVDLALAERAVADVAATLLRCGRVYTDRLHCAILATMLDRYVVLMPNSYFKNGAVFDHSLSRFANVRFEDGNLAL